MSKIQLRQDIKVSVAAFIAAGGKVTKCPVKTTSDRKPRFLNKQEIDLNALPEALKIRFGMRL